MFRKRSESVQPDITTEGFIAPYDQDVGGMDAVPFAIYGSAVGVITENYYVSGQLRKPKRPDVQELKIDVFKMWSGNFIKYYSFVWGVGLGQRSVSFYYSPDFRNPQDKKVKRISIVITDEEASFSAAITEFKGFAKRPRTKKLTEMEQYFVLCRDSILTLKRSNQRGIEFIPEDRSSGAYDANMNIYYVGYGTLRFPQGDRSEEFSDDSFVRQVNWELNYFREKIRGILEGERGTCPEKVEEEVKRLTLKVMEKVQGPWSGPGESKK
jgi:hypothetical protein